MTVSLFRPKGLQRIAAASCIGACAAFGALMVGAILPAHAQQPAQGEIVVKFKDDAKVKDIIDAFWRDQTTARSRFAAFRETNAAFAGLRLERVTYSNELVLVPDGGAAPGGLRAIARALAALPDISYADPNMTAHTGAQ